MASRNTIALMTATRRRMPDSLCRPLGPNRRRGAARRTTKNAPSRFAPSSGFPIDLRRSGCRSGSHQPPVLRSRCTRESRGVRCAPSSARNEKSAQFALVRIRAADFVARCVELDSRERREQFAIELRANKKCTGAVAPSSGFLTDLRRSGCRSGDHQPQVLLPRCNHHSRGSARRGQVAAGSEFPQIANICIERSSRIALRA